MNQSFLFTKGTLFFQVGDALGVSAILAGGPGVGEWVTPSKQMFLGFDKWEIKKQLFFQNA